MLALLSCVSSSALWVISDAKAQTVLSCFEWTDRESSELATLVGQGFERALKLANIEARELTGLLCVTGPGAFTGLRVSGSFLMGLARALGIPARGIPSFDLLGESFFLPLQHQKARDLSLDQILATGLEFLELRGAAEAAVAKPVPGARVVGLAPSPSWPNPEELLRGARKNLERAPGLAIFYGLNPKIAGVREPMKAPG